MSTAHIEAIRSALEHNHWVVLEERLVDEYSTTAFWRIARPDGAHPLTLRFEGGYDAEGLTKRTFVESIGCSVVEHPQVGVYFARVNRSWRTEFRDFIGALNGLS